MRQIAQIRCSVVSGNKALQRVVVVNMCYQCLAWSSSALHRGQAEYSPANKLGSETGDTIGVANRSLGC